MKTEYKHLIPPDFNDSSRVWIYQSNRVFAISEALQIEDMLHEFVGSWQSHGVPVKGYANLFFGQFIILMADETATGVSGCSTDSSVRLIKQIEQLFDVHLFDRRLLAFLIRGKVEILPMNQLNYALQNGFISADTIYFNNLVQTKEDLIKIWMMPLKESWLAGKMSIEAK